MKDLINEKQVNIPNLVNDFFFLIFIIRHKFLAEFLEVGGVLTVLEILGLKQAKEVLKVFCLVCLFCHSYCLQRGSLEG